MKILIVGDWHSDLHEEEMYKSLKRLGHIIYKLKWANYFYCKGVLISKFFCVMKKAQNKYIFGPLIKKINDDLLKKINKCKPDVVFIYRGTHIQPKTIKKINNIYKCIVVGYNNDDPFSQNQPNYLWRHFNKSIPFYDLILAYRHINLKDYKEAGAKKTKLLRSWFVPDRSYPVINNQKQKYNSDVVFIGHYEPDTRLSYLESIMKKGYNLKLFGPGKYWEKPISNSLYLKSLLPINMAWGEDYNKALCGSSIALCFFSKLNRDTYTRRCFEIPATGTFMLCEYSDDIASIFKEGVEAEYFRNRKEMLDKINYYLNNPSERRRIALAGYKKVYDAGHDIDSRMNDLLKWINELKNDRN